MGDDTRIDSSARRERADLMAAEMVGHDQLDLKGPSRKEISQQAFDKGVENLTYGLTAPMPLQIWHAAKQGVDAVQGKAPRPPAPEVSGVRLYPLIEKDLPKTVRSDPASARALAISRCTRRSRATAPQGERRVLRCGSSRSCGVCRWQGRRRTVQSAPRDLRATR